MENEHLHEGNLGRVAGLLHIVSECAKHGNLQYISSAAMTELRGLDDKIKAAAAEEKKRAELEGREPERQDLIEDKSESDPDPVKPTVIPRREFTKETSDV